MFETSAVTLSDKCEMCIQVWIDVGKMDPEEESWAQKWVSSGISMQRLAHHAHHRSFRHSNLSVDFDRGRPHRLPIFMFEIGLASHLQLQDEVNKRCRGFDVLSHGEMT